MERVDVAIIGSGPAGISAVLNAKIRNLSYIFFGKNRLSEKVERAEQILNYPGLGIVSGNDMAEAMRGHGNMHYRRIDYRCLCHGGLFCIDIRR